jgi:hypothetical protein
MTAFLRNTFLAAVAVSSMAGSALADQTTPSCTKHDNIWGNCCYMGGSACRPDVDGNHGDHGSTGGRGGPNGPAGAK